MTATALNLIASVPTDSNSLELDPGVIDRLIASAAPKMLVIYNASVL